MEPAEFIFRPIVEAAADISQAAAAIPLPSHRPPSHPPPYPESQVVRKRGRPAKPQPGDQAINVPISADFREEEPLPRNPPTPPPSTTGEKRKRGRPFKVASDVDNVGAPKTKLVTGVDKLKKRSAGRPRKVSSAFRPRGRPPRTVSPIANGGILPTTEANGQLKEPIANTRKPAKRPSKNDVPASRGPPLWMVDYNHVKSKLDNVQTRITNALCLLKPHLVNENVPSVATALQELEEISRMNVIGAPFHAVQEQESLP